MKLLLHVAMLIAAFSLGSVASEAQSAATPPVATTLPSPSANSAPTAKATDTPAQQSVLTPDADLLNHILQDKFDSIATCAQLPKAVLDQMASVGRPLGQHIADPGKPWNDSDMILDEKLPRARLMFAAADSYYCIICCEYGGYGYHREVFIYSIKDGLAEPVASGFVPTEIYNPKSKKIYKYTYIDLKNLDDLRQLITSKQVQWDSWFTIARHKQSSASGL